MTRSHILPLCLLACGLCNTVTAQTADNPGATAPTAPTAPTASTAPTPAVGSAPSVLWLELRADGSGGAPISPERERALRFELESRGIVLLRVDPPEPPGAAGALPATADPTRDAAPAAPASAQATAAAVLASSSASAIAWLEGDPERPISWLRVLRRRQASLEQAPLPHPPEAIEPELLAVALSGLLDQLLNDQAGVTPATATDGPAPEPPRPEGSPRETRERATAATAAATAAAATAQSPKTDDEVIIPYGVEPAAAPVAHGWFVQLGFVLPVAAIAAGMEAASDPPADQVFIEEQVDMDGMAETLFFFDDGLAWVPDADSFDDFGTPEFGVPAGVTPVSTKCKADGVVTRAGEMPSSFCARVDEPGLVFIPALRLALGTWLSPRFALALVYQWHFGIRPESFLGNQSLGLQGELLLLGAPRKGLSLSLLAAVALGRTETPVESPGAPTINALGGPLAVTGGASIRYAFSPDFGLLMSPSLSGHFPATQLAAALTIAGEVFL